MLSLWNDALTPDLTPPYPTYSYLLAKGGEDTYDLSPDGYKSIKRTAVAGEKLRTPDLSYISDWTENLYHRMSVSLNCDGNDSYRSQEIMYCKSSILYWINTYVWTFDPRLEEGERRAPFATYEFQDDAIKWMLDRIQAQESAVIEKSRDMGASWMMAAIAVWMCVFYENMVPYFMSMREFDVDDRTPDSLFGKCRFLLENLPEWQKAGWIQHANDIDTKMSMKFPKTGSNLKGILSKGTAGRSGRAKVVMADEFAFVEDSEKVLRSLGDLSKCKFYVSTANGMANAQYRMAMDRNMQKLTLHWKRSNHPMKNTEWATLRRNRPDVTAETWASEQEIDYAGSTPGRVYSKFISVEDARLPWCHVKSGPYYEYDKNYDVWTGQDYGQADDTFICYAQRKPSLPEHHDFTKEMLVFVDEDYGDGITVDEWRYILNNKGYRYAEHIGDWRTGNQSDSLRSTWIKNFRREITGPIYSHRLGMSVDPGPVVIILGRYVTEDGPIQTVQRKLNTIGAIAINPDKCPMLLMAAQNWSYPTQENPLNGITEKIPGSKPNHDAFSHAMKAFGYIIDWLYGKDRVEEGKNFSAPYSTGQQDQIPWDFRTGGAKML